MVLDVYRTVAVNEADPDDAFHATFCFSREAGSIRKAARMGSWLPPCRLPDIAQVT